MSGAIKLVWLIAFMMNGQQSVQPVPENVQFKDLHACHKFGTEMTPRMEDWVRGVLRADWEYPVAVKFQCGPNGDPA